MNISTNMIELNEQKLMLIDGGDFGDFVYSAGKSVGKAIRKAYDFVTKESKTNIYPGMDPRKGQFK